ncbi:MAG: exodeoxyribonuclease VII small subunit [Akkermansiaceae bacterium]
MPPKKIEKLPSFEQALEELEEMVDTMESGELALEELITSYERGAKLVSHCESVLDDARKRLELITINPKSPNDGAKESTPSASSDDDAPSPTSNDDEIRLF